MKNPVRAGLSRLWATGEKSLSGIKKNGITVSLLNIYCKTK
jgi:hypothetical protein